jgi:hypothetical protein
MLHSSREPPRSAVKSSVFPSPASTDSASFVGNEVASTARSDRPSRRIAIGSTFSPSGFFSFSDGSSTFRIGSSGKVRSGAVRRSTWTSSSWVASDRNVSHAPSREKRGW